MEEELKGSGLEMTAIHNLCQAKIIKEWIVLFLINLIKILNFIFHLIIILNYFIHKTLTIHHFFSFHYPRFIFSNLDTMPLSEHITHELVIVQNNKKKIMNMNKSIKQPRTHGKLSNTQKDVKEERVKIDASFLKKGNSVAQ